MIMTESEIEVFSLAELKQLGCTYISGPSIAPDFEGVVHQAALFVAEASASYGAPEKRNSYGDVVLKQTLEDAIARLNPCAYRGSKRF